MIMANHGAKALAIAVSLLLSQASLAATHADKYLTSTARTAAIIGGDTNAIIGGDRQKAKRPSAIIGGDVNGQYRMRVIAQGPVDHIDATTGRLKVLGQEFLAPNRANLLNDLLLRVAAGDVVTATVYGTLRANGKPFPKSVVFSEEQQIPGVTAVTVLGLVQRVDRAHGKLVVGGLTVDYTPLLASGSADFSAGTVVEVVGVQFSANGDLVASSVLAL